MIFASLVDRFATFSTLFCVSMPAAIPRNRYIRFTNSSNLKAFRSLIFHLLPSEVYPFLSPRQAYCCHFKGCRDWWMTNALPSWGHRTLKYSVHTTPEEQRDQDYQHG
jgi:hypothetical protein